MLARCFVAAVVLVSSSLAFAQDEGFTEHPSVPKFPRTHADDATNNDFSAFDFIIADDNGAGDYRKVTREGKFWHVNYIVDEGQKPPGPLELLRNYENAFKKNGGKKVWAVVETSGGQATLMMPNGKGERWLHLNIANSGETYSFDIVDTAPLKQQIEVSADEMADQLEKNGFIALYGVLFDTGKDTIKPESDALIGEVAKLLTNKKDFKLSVEGHTDNVGDKKANQTLSQKRAEAVKKALVGKGIDGKRLTTAGFGDSKPVADNRGEDGRAKNRRVELVKK